LDIVQIHGEPLSDLFYQELRKINIEVIQAIGVEEEIDFDELTKLEPFVDYFLFDTKSSSHGGTGKSFDWGLLNSYSLSKPFLLAGGISLENFQDLPSWKHVPFWGVDVNSRFEHSPAHKNSAALADLSYKIDQFNKHKL
jgi:phosphoribosylanthranilate isomerase